MRLSKNLEALATTEDLLDKKDEDINQLTSELVMLNSNLEVKLISFSNISNISRLFRISSFFFASDFEPYKLFSLLVPHFSGLKLNRDLVTP